MLVYFPYIGFTAVVPISTLCSLTYSGVLFHVVIIELNLSVRHVTIELNLSVRHSVAFNPRPAAFMDVYILSVPVRVMRYGRKVGCSGRMRTMLAVKRARFCGTADRCFASGPTL